MERRKRRESSEDGRGKEGEAVGIKMVRGKRVMEESGIEMRK